MKRLNRDFYIRDSVTVAKDLLGKYLVHKVGGEEIVGRIVEVEAYMGPEDKAAHSYNNRRTKRNEVMYGIGGFSYVYFIYGMYHCMNVVVEEIGKPQAILIRALEPISNINTMAVNRYNKNSEELNRSEVKRLTNGPGKLCRALKIDRRENAKDLCGNELYIMADENAASYEMVSTTRINIDYAEEAAFYPWRFYIKDNPYVSKK